MCNVSLQSSHLLNTENKKVETVDKPPASISSASENAAKDTHKEAKKEVLLEIPTSVPESDTEKVRKNANNRVGFHSTRTQLML